MKIAIVNPWSISSESIGGTERFVVDLAESLTQLDNEIDVYMFSGQNYKKDGINYISLDLFGKNTIADEYMIKEEFGDFGTETAYEKLARCLENKIDSSQYDMFHLNSPLFLKCWQDKKRIFTHHSNYSEIIILWSEKEYEKMVEITKEEMKSQLTYFVTPSAFYKKEWDLLTDGNTVVIPHAINQKRLEINADKNIILKKYSLDSNKITVLLPSRLEPIQKQPMLFLQGCALLPEELKNNLQVILTGIDYQYEQYVKALADFSIENKINTKFIKFDTINEGYLISDFLAVPSKSESFGYSALEGLTLGITTILTELPSFKEIADGNSNARFFDGTASGLSNLLEEIIKEKVFTRILPDKIWLDRYNILLWGKQYLGVFENDESILPTTE